MKTNSLLKSIAILQSVFVLAFICAAIPFCKDAYASVPEEITVYRAKILEDAITNYEYGFVIYETEFGQTVYWADVEAEPTKSGTTLTLLDSFDPGLQYIMTNGYPYVSITGNDEMDMCITQSVIIRYTDEEHVSDRFKDAVETDTYHLLDRYINPLLSAARAKSEEYSDIKTMHGDQFIELPSSEERNLTLTEDESCLESPLLRPKVEERGSYGVGLPESLDGAMVVDSNGKERYIFDWDEGFMVRLPASYLGEIKQVRVLISRETTVPYVNLYGDPSNPEAERFVCLSEIENETVEKEMFLSVEEDLNTDLPQLVTLAIGVIACLILVYIIKRYFKRKKDHPKSIK